MITKCLSEKENEFIGITPSNKLIIISGVDAGYVIMKIENDHSHCFDCNVDCRKGLLSKIKPYGFTVFVKRFGEEMLSVCLERIEKMGIVYHREGITGDYDDFEDVEQLISFIKTGRR